MLPPLPRLRGLEHLQLVLCYDYVPFLRMLGTLPLRLKPFTVREGGDKDGTEFDRQANEFVRSMDSLQCLGLILDPNWEQPSGSLIDRLRCFIGCTEASLSYLRSGLPL